MNEWMLSSLHFLKQGSPDLSDHVRIALLKEDTFLLCLPVTILYFFVWFFYACQISHQIKNSVKIGTTC